MTKYIESSSGVYVPDVNIFTPTIQRYEDVYLNPTPDVENEPSVHIDYETFSYAPLKDCGLHRYATDETTEALCLGYKLNTWSKYKYWTLFDDPPEDLFELIKSGVLVKAWNAPFEMAIWEYVCHRRMGWPVLPFKQVRCTMALASSLGYPLSLDACGRAVFLPQSLEKDKEGKRLITFMCKPKKPTKHDKRTRRHPIEHPGEFIALCEYCGQDCVAEEAIEEALPRQELTKSELDIWRHTQVVNERGIPIDYKLTKKINEHYTESSEAMKKEFVELTDGAVQTVGQRDKFINWANTRGVRMPDLRKETVQELIKTVSDKLVRRGLVIRSYLGRSSVNKIAAILDRICLDFTIKGELLYHGAHTGRFAGRGVQVQNLSAEGYVDWVLKWVIEDLLNESLERIEDFHGPIQVIAQYMVRSCIAAPPGYVLIIGDYSSVENRKLSWLADDFDTLALFAKGLDQYVDMAAFLNMINYDEVTTDQRKAGKRIVLGCQFGMGAGTFAATSASYGVDISEAEAQAQVTAYRKRYKPVVSHWYGAMKVAVKAIMRPNTTFTYKHLKFHFAKHCLWMRLPSGRVMCYPEARVEEGRFGPTFSHYVVKLGRWMRHDSIPGRLTENATQASSRDILTFHNHLIERKARIPLVFHVHDEPVGVVKIEEAEKKLKLFNKVANIKPKWLPGFPLAIEGELAPRFKKD